MANGRDKTYRVVVEYGINKRSIGDVESSLARIRQIADSANEPFEELDPITRASIASVRQRLDSLRRGVEQEGAAVQGLARSYEDLESARAAAAQSRESLADSQRFTEALRAESNALNEAVATREYMTTRDRLRQSELDALDPFNLPSEGGRGRGRLSRLGNEIRMLPAVGIPGTGLSTDAVGKLMTAGESLGTVIGNVITPAFVAGAGAAVAFGVAVGVVINEFQKGASAVQAILDAEQKDLNRRAQNEVRIRSASVQQVEQDIEIQQSQLMLVEREISQRRQQLNAIYEQSQNTRDPVVFLAQQQTMGQLIADIENLEGQYRDLNLAIHENVNEVLPAVAVREAETRAIEEQKRATEEYIELLKEQRALVFEQAAGFRELIMRNYEYGQMTGEQARQTLRDMQVDILARREELRALQLGGQEGTPEFEALREELRQRIEEEKRLREVTLPMIDAREREAQIIAETNGILQERVNVQKQIADQATKVTDAETALAKARADLDAIEPRILAESEKKITAIREQAGERAAQIAQQYGEQEADAKRQLARELARIQLGMDEAVADRDAADFDRAKNRKALEEDEADEEKRIRREKYNTAIRELATQTDKQIRLQRQAAQEQINTEVAKARAEVTLRQQALDVAVAQMTKFVQTMNALSMALGQVGQNTQPIIPQTTTSSFADVIAWQQAGAVGPYQSRDSGGPVYPGRNYMINGEPFRFSAPGMAYGLSNTTRGGGGLTIGGINIYATSPEEIGRQVGKQVTMIVRQARQQTRAGRAV